MTSACRSLNDEPHGRTRWASSLVDKLQLAIDSGAGTVLLPAKNMGNFSKIHDKILDELELVFYTDPLYAASNALRSTDWHILKLD